MIFSGVVKKNHLSDGRAFSAGGTNPGHFVFDTG